MADGNEMFKKIYELSFDDIRSLIYHQLQSTLSENEYDNSWLSEVYETYFILSYWNDSVHKFFKVPYAKENEAITIDWENRAEVFLFQEWREIPEVQTAFSELNSQINTLTTTLNEKDEAITQLNSSVETLTNDKESIVKQFNEASEKITALSGELEVLRPIKEQFEQEQFEKALNAKKELYSAKFEAVKAKDKFETEEVQNLLKLSVNDNEEGKQAIFSLNAMLVDLVTIPKSDEKPAIKEFASKKGNLIPTATDFDSRYSE